MAESNFDEQVAGHLNGKRLRSPLVSFGDVSETVSIPDKKTRIVFCFSLKHLDSGSKFRTH